MEKENAALRKGAEAYRETNYDLEKIHSDTVIFVSHMK